MIKLCETFAFVEIKHAAWKSFQNAHQIHHFVLTTLSLIILIFLHLFLFLSPVQITTSPSSLTSGISSHPPAQEQFMTQETLHTRKRRLAMYPDKS